jgi:hypothetical protein
MRTSPLILFLCLGVVGLLAACATTQRLSAAPDVHRLLVAIRDGDQAAFDAHVDRRALEAEIQAAMVARTRRADLGPAATDLGLLLSGPLARAAGGALIRPDVFRAVADYYGYRPEAPIPSSLQLAAALTALPDGRVCAKLRRSSRCLLTFAEEGGAWRLVGVDAAYAFGPGERGPR